MRQKVLEYMAYTLVPFDKNVDGVVAQFKSQFRHGFGEELPPEVEEAVATIERAFRNRRDAIETCVAEIFEKHLTEADIDALLEHQRAPAAAKLREVSQALLQETAAATGTWISETMASVEPDLNRLLGGPTPAATEGAATT